MLSLCEELGISGLKEPIASADGGGRPGQSTCMEQLLGSGELLGKTGKTPVSALASKEVVGLYFSAHWCVLPVPRAPRESERASERVSE
jgi:hypothetical protein